METITKRINTNYIAKVYVAMQENLRFKIFSAYEVSAIADRILGK